MFTYYLQSAPINKCNSKTTAAGQTFGTVRFFRRSTHHPLCMLLTIGQQQQMGENKIHPRRPLSHAHITKNTLKRIHEK